MGALKACGKTIAVLGSGFDNIYPKENFKIFEEILNNDGTIITEYEPKTIACSDNFRKRNRIVSGLSMGILVVEAAEHSGTGITVNYARKQKRPIFCIPSNIDNRNGKGTNRLLKKDGILVTDANDILSYYNMNKVKNFNIDEFVNNTEYTIKEEYKEFYKIINTSPIHINQICRITGKNISEVSSILLMMELEGLVENETGNVYKIKGE